MQFDDVLFVRCVSRFKTAMGQAEEVVWIKYVTELFSRLILLGF
jgi:hypothetical protein